jgi:hypothetical protein
MNQSTLPTDLISRHFLPVSSKPKPSPQTYVHKRVTKSQRQARRTRSQSARNRLETKEHLITLAAALGEVELADKVRRCHSQLSILTCGQHVAAIIPNATCEFRLCPDCARRRSRKLIKKHLPIMNAFVLRHRVEPVHLVLTQKHRAETRKQSVKRLKDAFTKLQRRDFWKRYFKGGLWSVEFTKGKDGLHHTHLHIIAFRAKFFDVNLLRDEWQAVTGDSRVLRLDKIQDLSAGFLEVVKYISKPLDIERFEKADLADFLRLKNMRLFGTFGEYRKFSKDYEPSDNAETPVSDFSHLTEGCACPYCDKPLFDLRMSKSDLPKFYERIESTPGSSPPT